jgi:hypothetical protein
MTYAINTNPAFKSLEITFDSKPDEKIREALKALKFRWHNARKLWYGYAEEKALRKALGETTETAPKPEKTDTPTVKSTRSKKIRYYKAIKEDGKMRYVESWGEPLSIKLPDGSVFKCACEFYKGDGWKITDTATGILAQSEHIPNKKALAEYSKSTDYIQALSRIITTDSYKQSKRALEEYQKQFI